MNAWIDWLAGYLGLEPETVSRLLQSLAVLLVILVVKQVALHLFGRRVQDAARRYRVRRAINYTAGILALLAVGRIWFTGLRDIGVLLGLAAAGLAIALKEPLLNLAGWLYILTRRPFVVGDRIQIGDVFGDVVDIRMFQTYLLECGNWVEADQSTGRIALVPNAQLFHQPLFNYTHDFEPIWDELPVTLTFESNWRKAKALLTDLVNEHAIAYCDEARRQLRQAAGEHLIFYGKLTPIVYTSVRENGVRLTLRYLTAPRRRRGTAEKLWEAILDAFAAEDDIQFAYPTTRFFEHRHEAKPSLRAHAPRRDDEA